MKPQALFVAQPNYTFEQNQKRVWDDLPLAAEEARKLAAGFAAHGYELGPNNLLEGGEKRTIEDALCNWFESAAESSLLILYWTGHGCLEEGQHYLVCRNSPRLGITSCDAINPDLVGEFIAAKCKAEKILIILDTCHSGGAAKQIVNILDQRLGNRAPRPGKEQAYSVIVSAHPIENAQEAVFSKALRQALFEANLPPDKRYWTDNVELISADDLAVCAKKLMPTDISTPECKSGGLGQRFIPNPRHRANLPGENVEERQWRLSRSEAASHFELAARGIEVGEKGWFFSGRRRLLAELVAWLSAAEMGLRIVTGPPGAGKSAVMGRLATLSDPQFRQEALDAGVVRNGEDVLPPAGVIDVAVHAKGKTLDDCARALAKGLGVKVGQDATVDIERLVTDIGKLGRKITLMIDALDEVAGGSGVAIASRLIVPLGALPRIKVLVGTRRSLDGAIGSKDEDRHDRLVAGFGADAIIDDLADEPETHDDVASYVRRRLESSERHRGDRPEKIADAADRVATRADGVFLYARIVSRTLQDQDRLDGELPATALEAFEQDLRVRFEGNERLVDDLLGALAWGEGKGLTRRVWPIVANALVGRAPPYCDDDVAWVLSHAGWHIVEAGEDGQAVYRLAHQALADHYRGKRDETDAQGQIIAVLVHGIMGAGWLDADRYLWRHLADHAARAESFDNLIRDPGYLAVADPARLVVALPNVKGDQGRRFADIYIRVVDRLVELKPIERMPYIHMTAQMEDPDLAPHLEPPVATAWRCKWARTRPTAPNRVIGRHRQAVSSVGFGTIDGRPIVVSGSDDTSVRLWDARTGKAICAPLEGHTDSITSVAFGVIDGGEVIVSGSRDNTIRVWDARTGEVIGAPLEGHTDCVTSIAIGVIHGTPVIPVIVSGSKDKTIRLWDARTGAPVGTPFKGHTRMLTSVSFGALEGREVVCSGSDDNTIRLWDARTGTPIGVPLEGHADCVTSVAIGVIHGTPVMPVIVSGSKDKIVLLWNPRTNERIRWPFHEHTDEVTSLSFGTFEGREVIVSGSKDSTVRLWDPRTGAPIGVPLRGHTDCVTSVACGTLDGREIIVSGSDDNTIRIWEARTREPVGAPLEGHADWVTSMTWGALGGREVVVSGSTDNTIRLWDVDTGEPIGAPLERHTQEVTSAALGTIGARDVFVWGSADRSIRIWDVQAERSLYKKVELESVVEIVSIMPVIGLSIFLYLSPLYLFYTFFIDAKFAGLALSVLFIVLVGLGIALVTDELKPFWRNADCILGQHTMPITSIATGVIDGRFVVVSGSADKTLRLWCARRHKPIGAPLKGHTNGVTSVAWDTLDGREIIVSGSSDKTLRLWNARTRKPIGAPLKGHTREVTSVALAVIEGQDLVVSGSEDRTIRLWDERTGMAIAEPFEGHVSGVTSVAWCALDGKPGVASGSYDGSLRLWDLSTGASERSRAIMLDGPIETMCTNGGTKIVAGLARGLILLEIFARSWE